MSFVLFSGTGIKIHIADFNADFAHVFVNYLLEIR